MFRSVKIPWRSLAACAALAACDAAPHTSEAIARQSDALEQDGACLIGDETIEHACAHATFGPFSGVTAQAYPGFVFSDVNAPHTAHTITLPTDGAGFSGAVLFQPTVPGEFGFMLDAGRPLEVRDSAGNLLTPVGTAPSDPALCSLIAQVHVYALLDTETYTLVFPSTGDDTVQLITEYLGAEASCEVACEPFTLQASRTYRPAAWSDGELSFDEHVVFELPKRLVVTQGNAGNFLAQLSYWHDGEEVVCDYRGNGRKRYVLECCSNGAVAGQDVEADALRLHVQRGANNGPNQTTAIEVTIQPECVPHDHDGEAP
jgi:hypothetical protein